MKNPIRVLVVALTALMLAACAVPEKGPSDASGTPNVGDKIAYDRGVTLHLEMFLTPDTPLAQNILNNRSNPVKEVKKKRRRQNPASRHYDLRDAIVVPQFAGLGQRLATGGANGCVVDIVLYDVSPTIFGPTMILDKARRFVGMLPAPEVRDDRSVTFGNVRLSEVVSLVLPHAALGRNPAAEIVAKNCEIRNPGSDGETVRLSMRHRLDNVGQLFGLLISE